MPEAIYQGTAARYSIGPHLFEKDKPETLKQNVDESIAKFLRENPAFSIDGKGGVRTTVGENGEPVDSPVVPAEGFKSREDVIAFAAKWLPDMTLDVTRSTAELQRRVEAALLGLKVDDQGEVLKAQAVGPAKVDKVKPNKAVPV